MRKTEIRIVAAAAMVCLAALPAMAHKAGIWSHRPYYIEKSCNEALLDCSARMVYVPGENPGIAGYGSYWYPRATRHVRVFNEDHVAWCLAHYKTYNPHTDTFIGKRYRHYRCDSPYDGI